MPSDLSSPEDAGEAADPSFQAAAAATGLGNFAPRYPQCLRAVLSRGPLRKSVPEAPTQTHLQAHPRQ
eukprot:scaffold1228_cov246-Pinguiococcus_pyrenoidosus.AAC.13